MKRRYIKCLLPLSLPYRYVNVHVWQVRVRALFSYDPTDDPSVPCLEAALAFSRGDVLEIVSQEDPVWWQARHDASDRHISRVGLIPSRLCHER